jgi:hypothetical protein
MLAVAGLEEEMDSSTNDVQNIYHFVPLGSIVY